MTLKSFVKRTPILGSAAYKLLGHKGYLGRLRYGLSTVRKLSGTHPRTCTVCGYEGFFRAYGDPPRWDAECPKCEALERHRLLALFLAQNRELIRGRVIHFAAEPCVAELIRPAADNYQSADLMRSDTDLKLNLEELDLGNESVDIFVVSHVLEHVNDRKALAELHRCLKPGGAAIIMVPIVEGWQSSYENDEVSTPKERTLHFGQHDHVRYYGADIRDRIRTAGFDITEFTAQPEDCIRHGLVRGETVFLAARTTLPHR